MAVFSKSSNESVSSGNKTIVANGCNFSGTIFVEHNILIDGSFDGIITAKEDVAVGSLGVVKGELTGRNVVISGLFDGKVKCNCLEIMSGGQVKGKVMAETFLIDKGGTFIGESLEKGKGHFLKKQTDIKSDGVNISLESSTIEERDNKTVSKYLHKPK